LATGKGDGEGDTGRSMMLSGAVEDVRRVLPWRGGGWSSPVTVEIRSLGRSERHATV